MFVFFLFLYQVNSQRAPQKNASFIISHLYDLLNNVLSLGIHWQWKKRLVKRAKALSPETALDGATGTGDLATLLNNNQIKTTGIDISSGMLEVAKKKFPQIHFKLDDLTDLSFKENTFDISTVAFGVRNVENLPKALSELGRVTKKGVFILEFGIPPNPVFRKLYFLFMKQR